MNKQNDTPAVPEALVIERSFKAPRELVWKAWTDPERLMRWSAPESFTTPVYNLELRVGGRYLSCMRSPEGKDYWSTGVYREIIVPERLVCSDGFADPQGNPVPAAYYGMPGDWPEQLLVTITLEERQGGTHLTLAQAGLPASEREEARKGWNGSFDKLAALLAHEQAHG